MLINSLFLFLREMLPVFLLIAMLAVVSPAGAVRKQLLLFGVGLGVCLYFVLWVFVDNLGLLWDGSGLELFFFCCAVLQTVVLLLVLLFVRERASPHISLLLAVVLALVLLVSLMEFMSFVTAMWPQEDTRKAMTVGITIGIGLAISLSILLYFFLYWLRSRIPLAVLVILAIFVCGRFGLAINLLAQIGFIDSDVIWSTQSWLSDQQAVAQVLTSFIGYESTPIAWQVYGYAACLLLMVVVIGLRRKPLAQMLRAAR